MEMTVYILKIKYIATLEIQEDPPAGQGSKSFLELLKQANRSIKRQQNWGTGTKAKEGPPKKWISTELQNNLTQETKD